MYAGYFLQTRFSKTLNVSIDQKTRPNICFKTHGQAFKTLCRAFQALGQAFEVLGSLAQGSNKKVVKTKRC